MKIQNGFSLKPLTPEQKETAQDARLREAAKMYESHFLNEMVKAMRSTVHRDQGFLKPNMAEKIFSEQLDQQYVDGWSKRGGVGLADMIYDQIKEKYYNSVKRDFSHPRGALPIAPAREPHGLSSPDSIQMKMLTPPGDGGASAEYRFEVHDPSGAAFEARAPMAGTVTAAAALPEGWSRVALDHGGGLQSEMTFPGGLAPIDGGTAVAAGQKLGQLDSARPVLAWKLDWT
jgi:flagellar protein FlgJ